MTIEKHVVSLELAKQLKEAGYPQESLFYWKNYRGVRKDAWELSQKNDPGLLSFSQYAAPLASELGEELPSLIKTFKQYGELYLCKSDAPYKFFQEETEADARAKMWLYLKSEDLL